MSAPRFFNRKRGGLTTVRVDTSFLNEFGHFIGDRKNVASILASREKEAQTAACEVCGGKALYRRYVGQRQWRGRCAAHKETR